jgi:putative phage-type endonuclease
MNAVVQGTQAWQMQRVGKATASRISDILATLKSGGEAASRKNYRAELVAERLTGQKADGFSSAAMKWGMDSEPLARAAYEAERGVLVEEIGFADHPEIPLTGASPDGLVGDDGLIEIKCPNTATHIEYLLAGSVPAEHQPQMLWQMECTGRQWCDFVSYDPRLPQDMQLFIARLHRDEARIAAMREAVRKFLQEVEALLERLLSSRRAPVATQPGQSGTHAEESLAVFSTTIA